MRATYDTKRYKLPEAEDPLAEPQEWRDGLGKPKEVFDHDLQAFVPVDIYKDSRNRRLPETRRAKNEKKFVFIQLPVAVFSKLATGLDCIELTVLFALCRTWFVGYQANPIKLTATNLHGLKISRGQKRRALDRLEELDIISVDHKIGRSPIVTLNWQPLKAA
jgi:hypothetical protein